jgi:hypothetical protein
MLITVYQTVWHHFPEDGIFTDWRCLRTGWWIFLILDHLFLFSLFKYFFLIFQLRNFSVWKCSCHIYLQFCLIGVLQFASLLQILLLLFNHLHTCLNYFVTCQLDSFFCSLFEFFY